MIERKIRLKLDHFYSFWAAAPKGPTTYGTTQGDSKSPCYVSSSPFPLQTLWMTSQALRLAFRPSGWPSRPSGWSPDPQAELPGPLAVYQTLWLTSQAFWMASIPSCWRSRPTNWPPDTPYSPPDPLNCLQDLSASLPRPLAGSQ